MMKAMMMLGAVVGFLIGTGFGLSGRSPWPDALWRACAAALVAAVLTRWWSRMWYQCLRDSLEQRRHARPIQPADVKPASKA